MMRKTLKRLIVILLALTAVTSVFLNGRLITSWNSSPHDTNASYLSDVHYRMTETNYNTLLFSSDQKVESSRYAALMNQHDWKEHYGLLDAHEERMYYNDLSRLSNSSIEEMKNYQVKMREKEAKYGFQKGTKDNQDLRALRTPAAIAMAVAAIYTGRMIDYQVASNTTFHAQSHKGSNQEFTGQYFGLDSQILNSSFDYNAYDPKASLSKTVNAIDAKAGASYAVASQTTTIGVSKNLTEHLSVSYDHSQSKSLPENHMVGIGFSAGF